MLSDRAVSVKVLPFNEAKEQTIALLFYKDSTVILQ